MNKLSFPIFIVLLLATGAWLYAQPPGGSPPTSASLWAATYANIIAALGYTPASTGANTFTGNQDTGTYAVSTEIPNCASACGHGGTGTTVNKVAVLTAANPSTVTLAATSDTSGAVGVVIGGAGTTGNAVIARQGQASCMFDGATTAGDYVAMSSSVAGDCTDAGATVPTSGQILGRVLSTNGSGGTYAMTLAPPHYGVPTLSSLGGVPSVSNVKTYMGGYEQAVTETSETATCNWGNGSSCYVTMEANTTAWTLTMINPVGGQVYRVVLKQPAASGPCPLPTFSPTVTWAGGSAPALTATGGKRDVITCYYSTATTEYMCDIDKNF